jgi:membrane associated rhomboid family serine protease
MSQDQSAVDGQGGRSEPLFHAPWPSLLLAVVIIASYAAQTALLPDVEALQPFWFAPRELGEGRYLGLVTALFLHGGWAHALVNAGFGLAFGAAVARFFGLGPFGALGFLGFYIACGVLANLGFAILPHRPDEVLLGASGAVSGLAGAAARLMGRRDPGRLSPYFGPTVVGMTAAWITSNLLIGLFGVTILSGGAPIAWQAHIAGYLAGLFLIGPVAQVFRLLPRD